MSKDTIPKSFWFTHPKQASFTILNKNSVAHEDLNQPTSRFWKVRSDLKNDILWFIPSEQTSSSHGFERLNQILERKTYCNPFCRNEPTHFMVLKGLNQMLKRKTTSSEELCIKRLNQILKIKTFCDSFCQNKPTHFMVLKGLNRMLKRRTTSPEELRVCLTKVRCTELGKTSRISSVPQDSSYWNSSAVWRAESTGQCCI